MPDEKIPYFQDEDCTLKFLETKKCIPLTLEAPYQIKYIKNVTNIHSLADGTRGGLNVAVVTTVNSNCVHTPNPLK